MLKLRDGNIGENALLTTGAKQIIIHANIETYLEDDRSLDKNLEFLRDKESQVLLTINVQMHLFKKQN